MSIEAAKACIRHAQLDLDQALVELDALEPQPEPPPIVHTPEAFDAALAAAVPGDVIVCAVTLVYPTALTITTPGIQIRSELAPAGRMTATEPAPSFRDKIIVQAPDVTLFGLEITHGKWTEIVQLAGANPVVDRCRILGDPTTGARRGIAANASNMRITRNYISDCKGPYPGDDTQAICGWNTPGPVLIEDNYLCGASEVIMFGGADPSSETNVPSDITIRRNVITKRLEWQQQAVQVKNLLELKNARRVLIELNELSNVWGGKGQDGFAFVFTPRNQSGTAPYSTVEDVEVRNNHIRCASGGVSILGTDNNAPSGRLSRVVIHHNTFDELDPVRFTGTKKMIQIQAGPVDVTFDANEWRGQNLTANVYFSGSPKSVEFDVINNVWMHTTYGIFGSGSSTGNDPATGLPRAWVQYVESGTLSNNTEWPIVLSTAAWLREKWLRFLVHFGYADV